MERGKADGSGEVAILVEATAHEDDIGPDEMPYLEPALMNGSCIATTSQLAFRRLVLRSASTRGVMVKSLKEFELVCWDTSKRPHCQKYQVSPKDLLIPRTPMSLVKSKKVAAE